MENYLTKEGLEKLKEELNYLKTIKRKEIAQRLKQAISFGDLKENAAYDEAKDAQAFLEGRIIELKNLINNAVLIQSGPKNKIEMGATVTIVKILNKKEKGKEKYTIVGPAESDPINGKISAESPLGKKLLGLKEGNTFKIETPEGKVEYKVIKIE